MKITEDELFNEIYRIENLISGLPKKYQKKTKEEKFNLVLKIEAHISMNELNFYLETICNSILNSKKI